MSQPGTPGSGRATTKYARVAASVRARIEDGTLPPGALVPSGAALARESGYSLLTCRRALRVLVADGVLVSGASPAARPRVPPLETVRIGRDPDDAARALSVALATRRHEAGMTQPQLAKLIRRSVTTIGHAETGRLWHSRRFWGLADKAVGAGGELLALHDDYRAAVVAAGSAAGKPTAVVTAGIPEMGGVAADVGDGGTIALTVPERVKCVTITWSDGSVTSVCPPTVSGSSGGNEQ